MNLIQEIMLNVKKKEAENVQHVGSFRFDNPMQAFTNTLMNSKQLMIGLATSNNDFHQFEQTQEIP